MPAVKTSRPRQTAYATQIRDVSMSAILMMAGVPRSHSDPYCMCLWACSWQGAGGSRACYSCLPRVLIRVGSSLFSHQSGLIDANFAWGISTVIVYEFALRQYSRFVMNVCEDLRCSITAKPESYKIPEPRPGCSYTEAPTLNDVAYYYLL